MSRLIFASLAFLWGPVVVHGQARPVPGRDLLDFPIGSLAEAQPLAMELGGGLWNPATMGLPSGERAQIGIAAMNSPLDQGVGGQVLMAAAALPRGATAGITIVRMSVTDLIRTETDPQSVGGEIPYNTTVFSAGTAWQHGRTTLGLAARYRTGTDDLEHSGAFAVDAGVVADRLLGTPLRAAASTFLFSPSRRGVEPATFMGAVDTPLMRSDSLWALRGGYSLAKTEGRSHEDYLFGAARYRQFDARGGIARSSEFGSTTRRLRLGVGVHYARYTIGVAREDSGAGLGATYQFLLTSVFR